MNSDKCIAQGRIDGLGMIRVLRISPNEVITCSRDCACAKTSWNGSIQCSLGWVKKMVNFRTTALIIDYEAILDRDADDDWCVEPTDFDVIGTDGNIYWGYFICNDMVSPKGLSNGVNKLYKGTRGKFRIYYDTFPKDGAIAAIMVEKSSGHQVRIDLAPVIIPEIDYEDNPWKTNLEPQRQDDLLVRIESLEKQVKSLCSELDALRLSVAGEGAVPYSRKTDVMSGSGIGYQPFDKK